MRASGGAQAARGPGQGAERGGAGDAGRPRTLLMLCGCSDAEGTPPLRGPSRLERIGDFHVWPSRFSCRFKPILSQRPQRPGDTQGRSYHLYPEHAKTRQHASRRSQDKSTRRLSLVSKRGHCPLRCTQAQRQRPSTSRLARGRARIIHFSHSHARHSARVYSPPHDPATRIYPPSAERPATAGPAYRRRRPSGTRARQAPPHAAAGRSPRCQGRSRSP